jgi:predicted metal-dependent enzyme (double-stranded beta helix superfamily)
MNSAERLSQAVLEVLRDNPADAQKVTEKLLNQAMGGPDLLAPFSTELANEREFHMLRAPECAIKVFNFFTLSDEPTFPHDHAGLWGVYGVYSGVMKQTFFHEDPDAPDDEYALDPLNEVPMSPGRAWRLHPSQIHGVWSESHGTVAIAIYNGDLNTLTRRIYDYKSRVKIRDVSQWAARGDLGQSGGSLEALPEKDRRHEK